MPTITIDGQQLEFEGKKTILDVAIDNGLAIPHFCYHKALSIVASCRICLAEVAQPNPRNNNKIELIPKLVPTCQTMAVDGMVVDTQSPKSTANQKAVMEYLLINHPLDCPVCDQAGECFLQDYSYGYGRGESRFVDDKIKQPKKDIGKHVYLYSDRCIMCSRCVRFTREITETNEIGIFGRGNQEQIDVFPGKPLDNELSGNVVDICPVGALLDKDFLFSQRVWFLKQTPSIDGITASGDNISIEHNNSQVYRVKPRENMDVNQWWISDEIRYGWKFVHSEKRLTEPTRKQYGETIGASWGRAYEQVHDNLRAITRQSGDGSLALVVSPMLACEEAYLLGKLIRGVDKKATLVVGPIPVSGEDKQFRSGYKIYAEKCPNARGVKRVLDLVDNQTGSMGVLSAEQLTEQLAEKDCKIEGLIVTGNYPDAWEGKDLAGAIKKKHITLIDTLDSPLTAVADVVLPSVTWAEKAGTFENGNGRLQSFEKALDVFDLPKSEGQIAMDLLAVFNLEEQEQYEPAYVRAMMGEPFVSEVHHPVSRKSVNSDMQFVEL